jgi:hypothetical protein
MIHSSEGMSWVSEPNRQMLDQYLPDLISQKQRREEGNVCTDTD